MAEPWGGAVAPRIGSAFADVSHAHGHDLEVCAREVFAAALEELGAAPARVWAFLPGIDEPDIGTGATALAGDAPLDRYMRANLGRVKAYREARHPMAFMPAGTCVGHAGTHLVVHAMAFHGTVAPVENPRQRPAWQYSRRFGPASPPFTRAIVVEGRVIASGTAAVVGEETRHAEDLRAQWAETLLNLDALRAAAAARGRWRALQIYVRDASHVAMAAELARRDFGDGLDRILVAPLCRRELLVEMEGIADVEG